MKRLLIGAALLPLAGGCAGPRLFDDGPGASRREHGVNARWLDGIHRAELAPRRETEGHGQGEVPPAPHAPADAPDAQSTLQDLVSFAIANHPAVQAAHAEWAAARERITRARALPDPQVSYGIMVEQIDRDRDPIGHTFGVSQMLPWFGRLDAQAGMQTEAARAAFERVIAEQARVARAVKEACAEYAYTSLARSIVAQHRDLVRSIEEVTRIRYRGAEVGLPDVLRVQAEIDQLDVELRDLEDMITAQRARLNSALGRPVHATLPEAQRLPEVTLDADEQDLIARLAQRNPELRVQQAEVASKRAAMRVARLEYFPDIMLGVEYGLNTAGRMARMDGGGRDTLAGMVSVTLPIWREKYDAGLREAMAGFGAALQMRTGRQYDLEAEMRMALYGYRDARRRVELYGEVLRVRGEQVMDATLAAYRVGDATFTDVVQAQRELLAFELAHQRALADRFIRIAEIEGLLGRPIDSIDQPLDDLPAARRAGEAITP